MDTTLHQKLEMYVTHNNFPEERWDARGLYPSPDKVQQGMQGAITGFVRHLQAAISTAEPGSPELTVSVQSFLDEWDIVEFDTEEREFLYDVACDIMREARINPEHIQL
ncbi:hypothetical protein ACFPAF_18780 [Hymenobacter endophyticus]|uniref:CdiI immunity protein domain-containing protein n=1 Tax=Hymenobacter endophyticus TaxID=3076335 RepID=A0ABU3TM39_9BACT|nr:hypothetical protein [Hymenobacter endophyticus]MDU0372452.1 hypothetical protein [Hymenobacter endophyticus]